MQTEFDILDALKAPLLTFSASWSDCIPKRIKDIVPVARLAALKRNEQMATFPEVVVYLTTRAFVAPMDSDFTDIFTHVTKTFLMKIILKKQGRRKI